MFKYRFLLSVLVGLAGSTVANASSIALEFTSDSFARSWSELTETFGWGFSTNIDINVTALGAAFDSLLYKGLFPPPLPFSIPSSLQVGIWNASGTLMVSGTVLRTDPTTGHFAYHAITPVFLPAGDYAIGAYYPSGGYADVVNDIYTDPAITFKGGLLINSSSLADPTIREEGVAAKGNFGPDFQFTAAAPEPATWMLVPISFLLCSLYRCRNVLGTSAGSNRVAQGGDSQYVIKE